MGQSNGILFNWWTSSQHLVVSNHCVMYLQRMTGDLEIDDILRRLLALKSNNKWWTFELSAIMFTVYYISSSSADHKFAKYHEHGKMICQRKYIFRKWIDSFCLQRALNNNWRSTHRWFWFHPSIRTARYPIELVNIKTTRIRNKYNDCNELNLTRSDQWLLTNARKWQS